MQKNIRKGILAGGNWIIDQVKVIDVYPKEERLTNIREEKTGNGGAPFNVLKALHKMNVELPLEGIGVVGDDDKGKKILRECQKMEIDAEQMRILEDINTSYTDVMTVSQTGKRTFFHHRGANTLLDSSHFDFTNTEARIFHLGYLLLLDSLDEIRSNGVTGASKVFEKAKEAELITSADIVSEQSERHKQIVSSSLPFVDVLFLNEYEAGMLTNIEIAGGEEFFTENAFRAAEEILKMGVQKWVVIHFATGAIAVNNQVGRVFQPAIDIPIKKIKGSVGAGDAFTAGVLYGIHENWAIKKSLKLGVAVAAASLLDMTASDGILTWQECIKLGDKFGYKNKQI